MCVCIAWKGISEVTYTVSRGTLNLELSPFKTSNFSIWHKQNEIMIDETKFNITLTNTFSGCVTVSVEISM